MRYTKNSGGCIEELTIGENKNLLNILCQMMKKNFCNFVIAGKLCLLLVSKRKYPYKHEGW